MDKTKGIFEDHCRELPDKPYVSLTEAVTWIAGGDSRTDRYIVEMTSRHAAKLLEEWGNVDGPGWLIPHLELLVQDKDWQFSKDIGDFERQSTLHRFERVKRWLLSKKWTARDALDRVDLWLARDKRSGVRYGRCHDMIWSACAAEEIQLLGIERKHDTGEIVGQHEPIPFTFFLQSVFHWIGDGHHGPGELSPSQLDRDGSRDEILKKKDSRSSYLNVVIRREDVLRLHDSYLQKYQGAPPTRTSELKAQPLTRFSIARLTEWYKVRVADWPADSPQPSANADWEEAKSVFPGVPREVIRDLRRKHAPEEWKKQGRRPARNSRE